MSRVLALSRKPRIYIPNDFEGVESPPKFTVRSMTRTEYLEFQMEQADLFTEDDRVHLLELQKSMEARQKDHEAQPNDDGTIDALKELWDAQRLLTKRRLSNRRTCLKILRDKKYLTGWDNITVEEENEITILPFDPDNIDCLTDDIITELCNNILGAVAGDDLGNSGNPSSVENGTENKQMTEKNGTAETVETQATTGTETVSQ